MSQAREVHVPDLGDFADVQVIAIHVEPGARVKAEQALLEVESDKATVEVPAPFAGEVHELRIAVGDTVSTGDLVMTIIPSSEAPPAESEAVTPPTPAAPSTQSPDALEASPKAPAGEPPVAEPPAAPAEASRAPGGDAPPYAGPAVRRYARELGVELVHVSGTGRGGRVRKEDVQAYVQEGLRSSAAHVPTNGALAGLLPWPEVDHARYGPVSEVEPSRVQQISGRNMARNWVMIPHVTHFDKADITELDAFRKELNAEAGASRSKVTILAFFIKAAASALRTYPAFNVSFAGDRLLQKHYVHIGFAVDAPAGLMVPVIRDVDRKGIVELANEVAELSTRTRAGKLSPAEMTGGCFTVSSIGGIGGTAFTPIINAPEVAILGAARSEMQPVWQGQEFAPRLIQPLTLSWDHRAVDGVAATRFLAHICRGLSDLKQLTR